MRLKCIACEVLARPIYLCAAHSPHIVDVVLLKRGLHDNPAGLRARIQELIDDSLDYDAIGLAYGLCGQGTAGLFARRIPLVIPRAHDCITLYLGSRQRYQEQFDGYPGTYWYTQDYVERSNGSAGSLALGSGTDTDLEAVHAEYVEKYGQDNADYLMEVMGAWQAHYRRAAFIDMGITGSASVELETRSTATRRGWAFERLSGDLVLIRRLLNGEWDSDFLVLEPGGQVTMTYDHDIIGCR